jgi:imidazolonepropionase-like amidohydrolase
MHFRLLYVALATIVAYMPDARSTPERGAPLAGQPVPGSPTGVTAFMDVTVVPMDQERVLPKQTVLVQNGRITALGPSDKVPVPAGAVRVDGRGQYLIPGLADMHAHINVSGEPVYGETDSAKGENRLLHLWLANGVTTVRNLDWSERKWGEQSLRLRARAAAGEILSPRIYTSGAWTGADGIETSAKVAPAQVASLVAAYKAAGYDHLKVHEEGGRELWDSLVAAARREGMPIVGHAPRAESGWGKKRMRDWGLAAPMKSIEHMMDYAWFDTTVGIPAMAAATKRAGVWLCPTWMVEKIMLYESSLARMAFHRRLIRTFQDSGVGLLLGTDNAYRKAPATVHDELRGLVEEAGLTPYQALLTGTRNVAQYFGMLDSTGTVAVGKRADLVLLRGNPLEDIRNTAEPIGVMIGGRWVTRAELAPRWAGLQRRLYYAEYLGTRTSIATVTKGITLTKEQQAARRQFDLGYQAHRRALLDSLASSVTDTSAGHARLLRLLARRFSDYRAVLTPEQQTMFDANARAWMMQSEKQGYRVTVSGVTPE